MAITVRPGTVEDKPRILEIASQIWEGNDYVPRVIDDWLNDPNGEVAVGEIDGTVAGFAHIAYPLPRYAWMEGIRSDPKLGNRGIAKAITDYLVDAARGRGCEVAELSTYIENYASLHIIETHGFERVAAFTALSAEPSTGSAAHATASRANDVERISPDEALAFMQGSTFLDVAQGYMPISWHFYPLARGPEWVMGQLDPLLGIRPEGRLAALLAFAREPRRSGDVHISYLDGARDEMVALARHALHLAGGDYVEAVVPQWGGRTTEALEVYREVGFGTWHEGEADILVYRRKLNP